MAESCGTENQRTCILPGKWNVSLALAAENECTVLCRFRDLSTVQMQPWDLY